MGARGQAVVKAAAHREGAGGKTGEGESSLPGGAGGNHRAPHAGAPLDIHLDVLHQVEIEAQDAAVGALDGASAGGCDQQRIKVAAVAGEQESHRLHGAVHADRIGFGGLRRGGGELVAHAAAGPAGVVVTDLDAARPVGVFHPNRGGTGPAVRQRLILEANLTGVQV